jgi:hypothetical protein
MAISIPIAPRQPAPAFASPPATIVHPLGWLKPFAELLRRHAEGKCVLSLEGTQSQPRGHIPTQSVKDHDGWQRIEDRSGH